MSAHSVLTQRDRDIVIVVYLLTAVTIAQIRLRFFPTNTRGSETACYRRVSLLIKGEYLAQHFIPSLANAGRGRALLTLGPQGKALVAQHLGIPRSEIGRVRLDSPVVLPHHLALCDLRLSLELACERSGLLTLESWTTERELRQTPIQAKHPKTVRFQCYSSLSCNHLNLKH